MKVVQKALRYLHSAIINHLSIVISMSPEWMVAYNRFNISGDVGLSDQLLCFCFDLVHVVETIFHDS